MKRPQGFDPSTPVAPTPTPKPGRVVPIASAPRVREAKAGLREARRARKGYEKLEVKRFTRRARTRRRVILAAAAAAALFFAVLAAAVFSPALALQKITVIGATADDESAIHDALEDQLGTPLALVDVDEIGSRLAGFPLIRSYTTEAVPPHTLVVTVVERQPIGLVADGADFAVVDPAGIVLESVDARVAGLPVIDAGEASIGNPAFLASTRVLLALPEELLARVDTISATTQDDVTFVLTGGAQAVVWGSPDRSAFKARVLSSLFGTQRPSAHVEFDVSAPDAPVVRSR